MKAAIALIFFACVAGSMATDARGQMMDQLLAQGQVLMQSTVGILQAQLSGIVSQALGQLSGLFAQLGGRFDMSAILNLVTPMLTQAASGLLGNLMASLQGLIGGRIFGDISAMFTDFLSQITTPLAGIGQALLNQGLSAVLSSMAGSRFLGDFMSQITSQMTAAVSAAQNVISTAVSGLSGVLSGVLDASKPHLADLQNQMLGHGMNVLGSLSETVNNLHGSLVGGQ
ncbi:unnamed protein product [Adineta steineri]|uniref:Secreted protein n=1 Tax=Adineta steineri TaxID=433720 RepID=A0A815JYT8_9BILA|nr:unnamed protein product [Adineta steineri]CAF1385757.1 unnamed protein product [Adineta steineri]CAF3544096.1 unnamed protein product [Adineta steineri]